MHHPSVETIVTDVYTNLCATVEHLCLDLYHDPYLCPFPCPCVFLCPCLCLYLCLSLCPRPRLRLCPQPVQTQSSAVTPVAASLRLWFATATTTVET